jgi:hypothetical protein
MISYICESFSRASYRYGLILTWIVEEQNGNERAEYGSQLLTELSQNLLNEFGKGFSVTNLKQMRQFYSVYSKFVRIEKGQTVSDEFKLSWSHYLKLMRIDNELERKFYEIESYKNNWSLRELNRQYNTALFTRLSLSKNKNEIEKPINLPNLSTVYTHKAKNNIGMHSLN